MAAHPLLGAPVVDHVPEVETSTANDVLDGVLRPRVGGSAVNALALEILRDLPRRLGDDVPPDASDDLGLGFHDLQVPWFDDGAFRVADGPVAEGIVADVSARIERPAGHVLAPEQGAVGARLGCGVRLLDDAELVGGGERPAERTPVRPGWMGYWAERVPMPLSLGVPLMTRASLTVLVLCGFAAGCAAAPPTQPQATARALVFPTASASVPSPTSIQAAATMASPTGTPAPTATPAPTPAPTPVPLGKAESALAAVLPSALASSCAHVGIVPDSGVTAALTCARSGVTVNLQANGPEGVSGDAADWTDTCTETVGGAAFTGTDAVAQDEFAVGDRQWGTVDGCTDTGLWAWYTARLSGTVTLANGSWKDARAWWLKVKPVGRPGTPYGWGLAPLVPGQSLAKLKAIALKPLYKTLLRKVEAYQDQLVHFTGRVAFLDSGNAYVDVTPIGYGLYRDTVMLSTGGVKGRIIADDFIDFVGFVDGTTDFLTGDIPQIDVIAYSAR